MGHFWARNQHRSFFFICTLGFSEVAYDDRHYMWVTVTGWIFKEWDIVTPKIVTIEKFYKIH